jgi:hypothetical protein
MSSAENQELPIANRAMNKKAYRKPSVQVYGTLSEITRNANPTPATTNRDAGSPPSNRT